MFLWGLSISRQSGLSQADSRGLDQQDAGRAVQPPALLPRPTTPLTSGSCIVLKRATRRTPPMKSPEELTSEIRSERGEVVIPVHEYVRGASLVQKELNNEIRRLLVLGVRRFALDVGQVTRMDSESIGVLVQVFTIVNDTAGECRIINLPPKVKDIFNITGLF